MTAITLPIAHTWDGQPAADRSVLQLDWHRDGLLLRTWAPLAHDPPPSTPAGPTPRLWEHEVMELFLAGSDDRYLEIEIGPGGHHLVLLLEGVRRPVAQALPMRRRVRHFDDVAWASEAIVPKAWLPPRPWRANAYRIHGAADDRRYLASTPLPGPQPDFHQPERFLSVHAPARGPLASSVEAAADALLGHTVVGVLRPPGRDRWARSLRATLLAATAPRMDVEGGPVTV